jgi:hypothetical protein
VPNHGLVEHASDRGHDERAKDCSGRPRLRLGDCVLCRDKKARPWGSNKNVGSHGKGRPIRPMLGHALRLLGSSRGRSPARTYRPVHSDRCAPRRQLPGSLPPPVRLALAASAVPSTKAVPCPSQSYKTPLNRIPCVPAARTGGPMPRHQHRPLSPPGCLRTRLGILFSSRNIRRPSRL